MPLRFVPELMYSHAFFMGGPGLTVTRKLPHGDLVDISAIANAFRGLDGDVTCNANSKSKFTRGDHGVVNEAAKQLIDTMLVDHDPTFPVHSVIGVTFKRPAPLQTYDAVKLPVSIHQDPLEGYPRHGLWRQCCCQSQEGQGSIGSPTKGTLYLQRHRQG